MLQHRWYVSMFGGLKAQQNDRVVLRFQTSKTGALLAYLAYHSEQRPAREMLAELLWPDSEPEAGRNSLRVALASLRRQLEPPGIMAGSVLITDRLRVSLNPDALITDVKTFDMALYAAGGSSTGEEKLRHLTLAAETYTGELLPGYYEDWIAGAREHLKTAYIGALEQLAALHMAAGAWEQARDYALRSVQTDPLQEQSHVQMMRLHIAAGQPANALRQYEQMERLLRENFDAQPGSEARDLARQARNPANSTHLQQGAEEPPGRSSSGQVIAASVSPHSHASPPDVDARASPIPLLPLPLTRFFGREHEIAALKDMLTDTDTRLISLIGLGGCGKTRLALEAARQTQAFFEGTVCFVPLADVTEASRIYDAILNALGQKQRAEPLPLEQVVEVLVSRPSLLVLDNFEQLVEEGASLVATLLYRCPSLTCVLTSRHILNVEGEREFSVTPLPTPGVSRAPVYLVTIPSVQLFVNRAQAARPDFQVTARNAEAVGALCVQLEGIPLAVELAAALCRALTPAQILDRLAHRFDVLVSRRNDVAARHRALHAVLEWSYQQLDTGLQAFFRRLGVFRGGWTLEAAEAVCGESAALGLLTQLQERSLVTAEERDAQMRYRMLETVREYAQEQMPPNELGALSVRHLDYFLNLALIAEPRLTAPDQAEWLGRLEAEQENLRAALTWSLAEGAATQALQLAAALWRFWYVRGQVSEGRQWLAQALAQESAGEPTTARVSALRGAGILARDQGDYATARALLEDCLREAEALDDAKRVAEALNSLGLLAWTQDENIAARAYLERSLTLRAEINDPGGMAAALGNLGLIEIQMQEFDSAHRHQEESLAYARQAGNDISAANSLHNLGLIATRRGDYDSALIYYQQSLTLRRELGDKGGIADSLADMGDVARLQGQVETARDLSRQALQLYFELGDRWRSTQSFTGFAQLAVQAKQWLRAARLWGIVEANCSRLRVPLPTALRAEIADGIAQTWRGLNKSVFAREWAQGSELGFEQAVQYALESE